MQRRSKGEGSITKQPNGKYRVRVETAPVAGKRHWVTSVVSTRSEAVSRLKELQSSLPITSVPDTYKSHLEDYIATKEAQGLSLSTIKQYRDLFRVMSNQLGDIPLSVLSLASFTAVINLWRAKGLSERTIKNRLYVAVDYLDYLVFKGYIGSNVLSYYKTHNHKLRKDTSRDIEILSKEEHEAIKHLLHLYWLQYLEDPKKHTLFKYKLYVAYIVAYETGMRIGELCALHWTDIKGNTISVSKTLIRTSEQVEIEAPPKTKAGRRTIVVSSKVIDALKQLKTLDGDSKYVFRSRRSRILPVGTNGIRRAFDRCLKEAGITRPFTFHDIRHTNASLMIASGVPIAVIAERLGHSSVAVTYQTYAHVINGCEERHKAVVVS